MMMMMMTGGRQRVASVAAGGRRWATAPRGRVAPGTRRTQRHFPRQLRRRRRLPDRLGCRIAGSGRTLSPTKVHSPTPGTTYVSPHRCAQT